MIIGVLSFLSIYFFSKSIPDQFLRKRQIAEIPTLNLKVLYHSSIIRLYPRQEKPSVIRDSSLSLTNKSRMSLL